MSIDDLENIDLTDFLKLRAVNGSHNTKLRPGVTLREIFDEVDDEEIEKPCLICHL